MKKRILSAALAVLVLSLALCAAVLPTAAAQPYVVDEGDLLTAEEESRLEAELSALSAELGCDIVVVTTQDRGDISIMDYADDFYDYSGYREDGVALAIDMSDRSWHISTSGAAIDKIGSDWDVIGDQIVPDLASGNYYRAFSRYGELCKYYITYTPAFPFWRNLIVFFLIGLVVALIVTGVMRSKLSSVSFQTGAANYVRENSLKLNTSRDIYLYRTVTKTPIPQETRTSSSGGGTHISSSGHSHGGGGGHF